MWKKLWKWIWGIEEKKENKVTIKDFAESDMLADFKAKEVPPSLAPPEPIVTPVPETPKEINTHYRFEQKKSVSKKIVPKKKVGSKKKK